MEPAIARLLKTPLDKALSLLAQEVAQIVQNRHLEYQSEEYKRNSSSKTILHRSEPKALKDFYQPLFITDIKKQPQPHRKSTESAKKLFTNYQYLTIIGSAGSGKSTIIKHLFVKCIDEGYRIPIRVELRYLNDYSGTLVDYIFNVIFIFQKLGISKEMIERLLSGNQFVFFLDGYDEINIANKSNRTKEIDAFVSRFPKHAYLVSSRPHTNIEMLPSFVNFSVCELEQKEIAAFVRKQLPISEQELADKIIKAIEKSENQGYRSFLSNPLLLSMFILTFQSYSDIPEKRSEFYSQVFDTLFSIHDSVSKLAYVREKTCGLNKESFEEILRLFSFMSFFEEKFLFPDTYLNDKLNFIKSKKVHLKFVNENLIDDLQIAIGIMNKEGLDYTFPHRSLQEYFTASYIGGLSIDNKKNVYSKHLRQIKENIYTLLDRDHFYLLLSELDYVRMTNGLTLPLLRDVQKRVSKEATLTTDNAYKHYTRLRVILILLARLKNHLPELERLLGEPPPIVLFGRENGEIDFPKNLINKDHHLLELERALKYVNCFKKHGQEIIDSIQKHIDDIDKSDEAIIDFV